jgi:hypothetical protein
VGGQTKPHGAFAKFRQGEKNKVDKIMRVVGNLFDIQREIAGPSMYDIIVINNVPENVADNLVPTPVVNLILEHQYLEPISEAYREIRR